METGNPPRAGAEMLVSAEQLAGYVGTAGWRVVDCRFNLANPAAGEVAYRKGHIPGALYAHLDRDLASARTPSTGRHPLPHPEELVRLFSRWGISPATRVVAYDDAGGAIAARLWWLLRWMGHESVGLLDGGFPAWQRAGLPVSAEPPQVQPAQFRGQPGHMPLGDTSELARRLGERHFVLLDARARPRFLGDEEPIDPVAGHVPGAINQPFGELLGQDGRFRTQAELSRKLAGWQDPAARGDVTVMCGSGVTACHLIFAMELVGIGGARLYPGSWSEWIRSPERPVATGEA